MLTVHHLGMSQSERIVWLCEELGLEYELRRYSRDPVTRLAPPELLALHPSGTAPVITDGSRRACAASSRMWRNAADDFVVATEARAGLSGPR